MMFASSGPSIKFWSSETFDLIQELPSTPKSVSGISWNKDGQFLSAFDQKTSEISLYTISAKNAVCSGVLRVMDNVSGLEFCNTSNRYLAVGGGRDSVLIWDVKENARKKSFTIHKSGVTKLSFNTTDSHIVVGTNLGEAFLLSNTNNLVNGPVKLFQEKTKVTDICFSSLRQDLVGAVGESGCVAFLDTNAGKVLKEFQTTHSAPASRLAFSPVNDLLMITVGYDKKFVSYNARTKSVVMSQMSSAPLTCLSFLNNGQCVALGTMLGEVFVYDLRILSTPLNTFKAHKGPVLDLRLQPQGKSTKKSTKVRPKSSVLATRPTTSSEQEQKIAPPNPPKLNRSETERKSKDAMELYPFTSEILSPIGEKTRLVDTEVENTPPPKNFGNTAPFSPSAQFDESGILSPLEKDSRSSLSLAQKDPKKWESIRAHSLLEEGFISPLSSRNSSPLHPSSEKRQEKLRETPEKSSNVDLFDINDLVLSPVKNFLDTHNQSAHLPSKTDELKPVSEPEEAVLECRKATDSSSFTDSIKKDLSQLLEDSNKSLNAQSTNTCTGIEIAFPKLEENEKSAKSEAVVFREQQNCINKVAGDSSHLNLTLIQNYVSEALERHQFEMDQKFMHLHCSLLKQIFYLKKAIKESSINEELLAENERLREELRRQKCNF